jgi:hypothetical protein
MRTRTGPPPAPRRTLNPAFRQAARQAMASGFKSRELASLAGFPFPQQLGNQLHAPVVRATPLVISRLQIVAAAIAFDGPLFVDSEQAAQ